MKTEWVVLRDSAVWSDRLNSEAECLFHIQECMEKETLFKEDDYTYRKMTKEEIEKYENEAR